MSAVETRWCECAVHGEGQHVRITGDVNAAYFCSTCLETQANDARKQFAPTAFLDGYQALAMRTHVDSPVRMPCYALGLTGEAGEVADLLKKHIGHGHELDVQKLKLELGDVLWYVAGLAHLFDLKLSEIATANINKLERRYPNGFSHEASKARKDVES